MSSDNGHRSFNQTPPRVLVAGARGSIGSLVAELIDQHPSLELGAVTTRDPAAVGVRFCDLEPEHRLEHELRSLDDLNYSEFDAAMVAFKQGDAAELCRTLLDNNLTVVDSCADFRFSDQATYEAWYQQPHLAPELIADAVYGLPELNRSQLKGAKLVGNPGCYPTAALLALAPLAREGLIQDLVIDAKSGVSGAGKRGGDVPTFVGTDENMRPYGIEESGHKHQPEIAEQLGFLGYSGDLTFVPHLVPLDQGELVSCYVKPSRSIDASDLVDLYESAYADERFVEIGGSLPSVREVHRTNICRLFPMLDPGTSRVMVFATLDNLWKGGASQAVQNLNLALGLPEHEGIPGGTAVHSSSPGASRVGRPSASVQS